MNYLSIRTLASVFQGTISLLPLLATVWGELKINEKIQLMGINKHHGTPFGENVCHMSYLPFINGSSLNPRLFAETVASIGQVTHEREGTAYNVYSQTGVQK